MEQQLVNPSWSKERRRELRVHQTPAEELLWDRLRQRRCGGVKFRRQVGIGPYIVDFYTHEGKIAVELDGAVHDNAEAKDYDKERDLYLVEAGVVVLRFSNNEFCDNPDRVLESIILIIRERIVS